MAAGSLLAHRMPRDRSVVTSQESSTPWERHGFHSGPTPLIAERTLPRAWTNRWTETPDSVALADHQGRTLTYDQLRAASTAAATLFVSHGVGHGTRVLVSATPSIDLIVVHVALMLCGAVVVPVNTGFTTAEITNIAQEAQVTLAVMSDPSRLARSVAEVVSVDLHEWGGIRPADADDFDSSRLHQAEFGDPAMLLFTSGTTGRPKGALLSHGNLLSSAAALVLAWKWAPADRLVLCLPLFHMHGLGVGVHGTLLAGASAVVLPAFGEEAVFDALHDPQTTMLFGVPTMWTRLLASRRVGELARLRLCVSGSAPLDPEVWNGLAAGGGQRVVERYGMTETVMLTSNPVDGERKAGTVGFALPGVDVRVHDPGTDGVGEIVVRGPNVFSGYLDRPEANAEAFLDGGWFRTGDLGRFDANGYLSIVGRSKDLIITGGYNVYPSDVEAVLRGHPDVIEVAVIGEPSELWGETVTACVVAAPQATNELVEAFLAWGAEHLASYQRPRRVVLVDVLPRNALGKVLKAELAEQVHRAE